MEKGRRDFLKKIGGGLVAISLMPGAFVPRQSKAQFNEPSNVIFNSDNLRKMDRSQKLDLADRLGEGVVTHETTIQDYWTEEGFDDILKTRVMLPYEIRFRPKTGEVEFKYGDPNDCNSGLFSIFNFASVYSEPTINFAKTYLNKGKAEKDNEEIVLKGNNLEFLKNQGRIISPRLDGTQDKAKLTYYLQEGLFNNKDPEHQKIGNEFAYRIIQDIANDGNCKEIRTIINPDECKDIEFHYPVSVTVKNDSHKYLVTFPQNEHAIEMKQCAKRLQSPNLPF